MTKPNVVAVVRRAESLLRQRRYEDVIRVTSDALRHDWKADVRLWRLRAVAEGMLGDHWESCESTWRSLCLKYDEYCMANYITSLLALDCPNRAYLLLWTIFPHMGEGAQKIVIHSTIEALRNEILEPDLLPTQLAQKIVNIFPLRR